MVKKSTNMENISLIIAFAIIFMVSYTWADCKATFTFVEEEDEKLPVTTSYLQSRDSGWERFKNIMRGRLVDPICTSKQEVLASLCECITKKKPTTKGSGNGSKEQETKESCTWTIISKPNGIGTSKYANLYPCGDVFVTQGYAAYDGNVHDVFVVEEKKKDPKGASLFVFKQVARAMDFDVFKEENHSFWSQLYLQGISFLFNLDKHLY